MDYETYMDCSGFEPEMIPAAMLAHRIMGIMAHWREYMGEHSQMSPDSDGFLLTNAVSRGKLFRPSHIYTGNITAITDPAAKM
jgi:citrate synthase